MGTERATIIVAADVLAEREAADRWLKDNQHYLTYRSEDEGCGCCVHIWNVEGPADVIRTLPPEIRGAEGGESCGNV
jgi:hypothetical protein